MTTTLQITYLRHRYGLTHRQASLIANLYFGEVAA